jgi:hypothetical protein
MLSCGALYRFNYTAVRRTEPEGTYGIGKKMKKTLITIAISILFSHSLYPDFRGHEWGADTRSVISKEAAKKVYVKDVYRKINPPSIAIQFNTTQTDGFPSMPVMHFDKDGHLFFTYWTYMGSEGEVALKELVQRLDARYTRAKIPQSISAHVIMKSNLSWKTMDSFIFINTLNNELLSLNFYKRQ